MTRITISLATASLAAIAPQAHAAAGETAGGSDPIIIVGGAVIIMLLLAVAYLLGRRDRPLINQPTEKVVADSGGSDAKPSPIYSKPGLKGYVLHGFDHNQARVRLEFTLEELQGDGCIIGRGHDAQKQLTDSRISRVQARLKLNGEQLEIEHLKETNRTTVNGQEVPFRGQRNVQVGDKIKFGPQVELRVAKLTS
jgi:hypothetical protein